MSVSRPVHLDWAFPVTVVFTGYGISVKLQEIVEHSWKAFQTKLPDIKGQGHISMANSTLGRIGVELMSFTAVGIVVFVIIPHSVQTKLNIETSQK